MCYLLFPAWRYLHILSLRSLSLSKTFIKIIDHKKRQRAVVQYQGSSFMISPINQYSLGIFTQPTTSPLSPCCAEDLTEKMVFSPPQQCFPVNPLESFNLSPQCLPDVFCFFSLYMEAVVADMSVFPLAERGPTIWLPNPEPRYTLTTQLVPWGFWLKHGWSWNQLPGTSPGPWLDSPSEFLT